MFHAQTTRRTEKAVQSHSSGGLFRRLSVSCWVCCCWQPGRDRPPGVHLVPGLMHHRGSRRSAPACGDGEVALLWASLPGPHSGPGTTSPSAGPQQHLCRASQGSPAVLLASKSFPLEPKVPSRYIFTTVADWVRPAWTAGRGRRVSQSEKSGFVLGSDAC